MVSLGRHLVVTQDSVSKKETALSIKYVLLNDCSVVANANGVHLKMSKNSIHLSSLGGLDSLCRKKSECIMPCVPSFLVKMT